ncbi:MAG: hypothetical protein FJ100_10095 [Deltaproteobacteria bacterium]|nr:hypothetical protein [Deltaproteobacteria bacterium]
MKFAWIVATCVLGCTARQAPPYVQDSSGSKPAAVVKWTAEGLSQPCVVVEVGETVEWRNLHPAIPANVTGFGNDELYSPSLVEGGQMATEKVDGGTERFAWWRHTFRKPGVFEYFDTNRGEPGRKVVDPYYGTVTYVGVSPTLQTGVVCVQQPGTDQCTAVCCLKDNNGDGVLENNECPSTQCCDPKGKRCLLGAPSAPICAPGIGSVGFAAFRNFECFTDADCTPDSTGAARTCAVDDKGSHVCRVH